MASSPVLMQVEGVLRPRFKAAQQAGKIDQDAEFRIMSFPIEGEPRKRRYRCVDLNNTPLKSVAPYDAVPTISD